MWRVGVHIWISHLNFFTERHYMEHATGSLWMVYCLIRYITHVHCHLIHMCGWTEVKACWFRDRDEEEKELEVCITHEGGILRLEKKSLERERHLLFKELSKETVDADSSFILRCNRGGVQVAIAFEIGETNILPQCEEFHFCWNTPVNREDPVTRLRTSLGA